MHQVPLTDTERTCCVSTCCAQYRGDTPTAAAGATGLTQAVPAAAPPADGKRMNVFEMSLMGADLDVFKACADRTRLRTLVLLGERELCVCELVEALEMAQAKISRHLAVLRRAGLVQDRREGTWIYYSLRQPGTPLMQRLHAYLRAEAAATDLGRADLERLRDLVHCGEICGPRCAPETRLEEVTA